LGSGIREIDEKAEKEKDQFMINTLGKPCPRMTNKDCLLKKIGLR